QKYLKDNSYKTVRETDLLTQLDTNFPSIDDVSTATDFLDNWIRQKGFPYVNITKEANGYRIRQQRFLLTPSTSGNDTVWKIPFSYYNDTTWDTQKKTIRFITQTEDLITDPPQNGLVKFNVGHNGFFLVNYPKEMWTDWI